MSKVKRKLSGIYYREMLDGKWSNVVFEDLSEERQDQIMHDRPVEWYHSMIKQLANTINRIGDSLDLVAGDKDD